MKPYSILWLFPTLLVFAGCADHSSQSNGTNTSSNSIVLDSTTSAPLPTNSNHPSKEETPMSIAPGRLLQAVSAEDLNLVQTLLNQSTAMIDEQNEKGESPLLIAVHHNMIDIAKILIDHGANINLQDHIQDSPYLYAGAQGKTEILAYMLENSEPDQSIVNRFGGNALIPAAEKGHLANVKLLLTDGRVDIDHQNHYGYTALIEAVALRDGSKIYQDIVRELLAHGANKKLRDNQGKTAEDYARELGYDQLLSQLT